VYTLDASVWVNGFDQREAGHATSRQLLEVLRTRVLAIIVPNLVLAGVAGAIGRTRNDPVRAEAFATTLGQLPNVTVVALDEALGYQARVLAVQARVAWGRCGVCGNGLAGRVPLDLV
jgi:predicted nucleic acid-binding protein